LKDALIKALKIPATSPDAVITGEGTVTRDEDTLEIDYGWSEAVPYMDPRNHGFRKARLLDLP
jgi:hypothetical protein